MANKKGDMAHRITYGKINCSIWRNKGQNGVWFSTTFSRNYIDENGIVKDAQSFGRDDLLMLSEVARQAFLWVVEQSEPISETVCQSTCE